MKKLILLAIIPCISFGLWSCGNDDDTLGTNSDSDSDSDTDTDSDSDSDGDTDSDSDTDGQCVPSPLKPSNPIPADGATGVSTASTDTLNWMDAPLATHYDVYQGTDCPAPDYPDAQYVEVTESELTGLSLVPSTTYCWKVVAIDDAGCFTEGDTWTFETICPDPTAPTVTSAPVQTFLAGVSSYSFIISFSKDMVPLTMSDLTWAQVTGSGTLDSLTTIDANEFEVEFSGVVNGDAYTLTVETSAIDQACGIPIDEAYEIEIFVVNECELSAGTTAYSYLPSCLLNNQGCLYQYPPGSPDNQWTC